MDKGIEYTVLETVFNLGKVMFLSLAGLICRKITDSFPSQFARQLKSETKPKPTAIILPQAFSYERYLVATSLLSSHGYADKESSYQIPFLASCNAIM